MKKLSVLFVMIIALVAFAAVPAVMACGENASKTTASKDKAKNKLVTSKSLCSADKSEATQANAMQVNSGDQCLSKYTLVSMNIKGMTCGGCESTVKTALTDVDGVVCVKSIDHKSGTAMVYVDDNKMKDNGWLTKAVTNKGYQAEVIPAVAKTESVQTSGKSCSSTCTAAEKAACNSKKTSEAKTTATSASGTK
jgi:copper chaperone CopZ